MIEIKDKHDCVGCEACVQICPKKCIAFEVDKKGFCYPTVDKNRCIECSLCENVCPVLNQGKTKKPLKVYAAINSNEEVRKNSSSGGIFTLLAEYVLEQNGVVFGACFDENWGVRHGYTETIEGLKAFRGSKYTQSRIGNTYIQVKKFLEEDRKVLFTGTSCQISGLKKFLRKDYINLFTADIVCHGVPSPLVWKTYLEYIKKSNHNSQEKIQTITNISFRDKSIGWKKFCIKIDGTSEKININKKEKQKTLVHEPFTQNIFMQVFLRNLCLRPSCHKCPSKCGKCGSDITIADYWGIAKQYPDIDDDKGTSLVLINSHKGEKCFNKLNIFFKETTYSNALSNNSPLEHSVSETKYASIFWRSFAKHGMNAGFMTLKKMRPSLFSRGLHFIQRLLKR